MTMSRVTRRKTAPAAKGKRQGGAAMAIPALEEARARLDAARDRAQPWLTPEAFETAEKYDMTGPMVGPEVYRKP